MKKREDEFFKKGSNFGWLSREAGYRSLFTAGIKDSRWFFAVNPIYQTYDKRFRYGQGLIRDFALPPEIDEERQRVEQKQGKSLLELLEDWAHQED